MAILMHITPRLNWERAAHEGVYWAESLETEGFIHCSTPEQVLRTANAFFQGQRDLVVLRIDEAKVRAPIHWESPPDSDERFPHLYGPLDVEAVIDAVPLDVDDSGSFVLKLPN
jgi:uncharacterized protein (DUF952 family)